MAISLVEAPEREPVSLAECKADLRGPPVEDDAILAAYLIAAREHAESYIRGRLVTQTVDYKIDRGWPLVWEGCYVFNRIELPLHPVQSVTSVSYVDENGTTQTLSPSLYTVHLDRPVPYIQKAYNATWPTVRDVPDAVTVRFVCGYTPQTVPEPIKQAILLHVRSLYSCDGDKEACENCRDTLLDPYRVLRVS